MFMEHTCIDPFNKAFTIVSAFNKVYRTMFLQPDQIDFIPPQGYGIVNQFTIALCWLDLIAKWEGHHIWHIFNGWEQHVKGVKVDSLAEDGTVLEFLGCFYHAHKVCYPQRTTINPMNGFTMQELRRRCASRLNALQ